MTSSTKGHVSREQRGAIMLIGLDRVAKRNAFNMEMLNQLSLAYGEFERNDQARVAVVFAHGDHFTAGLDLADAGPTLKDGWKLPPGGYDPWGLFVGPRVSKPVIVAAQGYCLTLGIELMLASDINLCASNARFAHLEVQRGIFAFGGATLRLHQIAGWGNAMRWLLTGDEFDAHEACRMGLVQEVMAPEDLLPAALRLAQHVADRAPLGIRATLESARQAVLEGESAAAHALPQLVRRVIESDDASEGLSALQERRAADFKGR
ncbi:crotonase/enoyl-CoA hydratase family protein [Pseudomonas sp. NFR16]|uniref:crotonase/enoyl-CoA hydratase family protein n=1 Tax=Pseudomonas sp. NFR16 TaxID=1566248 RepID=UPI0008C2FC5F|nr:crotonase/enoyl-CoA hydratase family protein [Pseudomonas sp. NFR16]SEJ01084.1 Enoyl-CoA hydratase/carnithine racemase [Pseudomonas sp. NFR16]